MRDKIQPHFHQSYPMSIHCLNLTNTLLHNWLGMSLVSFGKYYKNSKKHYTVIVLGSTGLTLLHSANSANFRKHFNHRDHFKSIPYGIWRHLLNEYSVCNN